MPSKNINRSYLRTGGKKPYGLLALSAVVVIAVVLGFIIYRAQQHASGKPAPTTDAKVNPVQEQAQIDTKKGNTPASSQDTSTPTTKPSTSGGGTSATATVLPVVSYAGESNSQIELHGYVPNIFEEGGTCTFQLTQDSKTVIKDSTGFQDVNKTTCHTIVFDASELAPGSWTVKLSYSSTKFSGTSKDYTLEVK